MNKKFSVTDVNTVFSNSFKCVKSDTFMKKALDWFSKIKFYCAVPVSFSGFCVPSLLAFENLLSKAVKYACDSSELGYNGLNSVYTLNVSDTCILYLFVSYFADSKTWCITLDFTDRIWLEDERNAPFLKDTSEDTKDTSEDTKDTSEDTKDTSEDTKDTSEDTKDTSEDTKDTSEDTKDTTKFFPPVLARDCSRYTAKLRSYFYTRFCHEIYYPLLWLERYNSELEKAFSETETIFSDESELPFFAVRPRPPNLGGWVRLFSIYCLKK